MNKLFCVVDIELTEEKEIIQFSATKLDQNFKEIESINYYIKPKKQVSPFVTELTGINNDMLSEKLYFEDVAKELYDFIKEDILVCHGLPSDYVILKKRFHDVGIRYHAKMSLDTVELARLFMPTQESYRLSDLSNSLALYSGDGYHNAAIDVQVTVELLKEISKRIANINSNNFKKIEVLLEKIDYNTLKFSRYCKRIIRGKKIKKEDFINFDGVDFKKVSYNVNDNNFKDKFIMFSSISEKKYIDNFKIRNYVILKEKSNYVPLNVFKLFPKKRRFKFR